MAMATGCTPHGGCPRTQRPHLSKVGSRPVGIRVWAGEGAWNVAGEGSEQHWGHPREHWEFIMTALDGPGPGLYSVILAR